MAEKLLSDVQCRNATAEGKRIRKLYDGGGLYLWVYDNGKKYWRLRYWVDGKEKSLSLGVYPDITLATARMRRAEEAKHLSDHLDPSTQRKTRKRNARFARENSFKAVANEWYGKQIHTWVTSHATDVKRRLEANLFPYIGERPISQIDAPELLDVLRKIEQRGAHDLAHRVLGVCGQVFRYAIATGRCQRDVAADLRGALTPHIVEHQKAVDPQKELPSLLHAIDGYDAIGDKQTMIALQLLMLTFVRTSELTGATWGEIDLADAMWHIPGKRMKGGLDFLVPLSRQSLALLAELKAMWGGSDDDFVFPGRKHGKPISNNTLLFALYRLGYRGRQTGHGFRRIASTLLNGTSFDEHGNMLGIRRVHSATEQTGFNPDVVERQLAHVEGNKVRGSYNMAAYLGPRSTMMQAWADYLDKVRKEAKALPPQ